MRRWRRTNPGQLHTLPRLTRLGVRLARRVSEPTTAERFVMTVTAGLAKLLDKAGRTVDSNANVDVTRAAGGDTPALRW